MKLICCLVNICYNTFPYNNVSCHLSVTICTHYRCFVFANMTVFIYMQWYCLILRVIQSCRNLRDVIKVFT